MARIGAFAKAFGGPEMRARRRPITAKNWRSRRLRIGADSECGCGLGLARDYLE